MGEGTILAVARLDPEWLHENPLLLRWEIAEQARTYSCAAIGLNLERLPCDVVSLYRIRAGTLGAYKSKDKGGLLPRKANEPDKAGQLRKPRKRCFTARI